MQNIRLNPPLYSSNYTKLKILAIFMGKWTHKCKYPNLRKRFRSQSTDFKGFNPIF